MRDAIHGNCCAQLKLAQAFEAGVCVTKNPDAAVFWYLSSAMQQNSRAMGAMGRCYEFGIGVAVNLYSAEHWYKAVSHQTDSKRSEQDLERVQEKIAAARGGQVVSPLYPPPPPDSRPRVAANLFLICFFLSGGRGSLITRDSAASLVFNGRGRSQVATG